MSPESVGDLSEEDIVMLQQARRGAQSLTWLLTFLLLTVGMYLFIGSSLAGFLAKAGGWLVCLLTAWVCMLFIGGLSKPLANAVLRTLSAKQRKLREWERQQG